MAKFKAFGFLKKSSLDPHGAKNVTFEFSAQNALEIAKLELMGRDLVNHTPVLLQVEVSVAKEKDQAKYTKKISKKHPSAKVYR